MLMSMKKTRLLTTSLSKARPRFIASSPNEITWPSCQKLNRKKRKPLLVTWKAHHTPTRQSAAPSCCKLRLTSPAERPVAASIVTVFSALDLEPLLRLILPLLIRSQLHCFPWAWLVQGHVLFSNQPEVLSIYEKYCVINWARNTFSRGAEQAQPHPQTPNDRWRKTSEAVRARSKKKEQKVIPISRKRPLKSPKKVGHSHTVGSTFKFDSQYGYVWVRCPKVTLIPLHRRRPCGSPARHTQKTIKKI